MASDNNFKATVDSLFHGMDSFLTSKTVVGEALHMGDTIILPLVDVTFGVAASAKSENSKHNGGGGMGGKMSPSAVLVIQNGTTKLVNVKNQDGLTKILDMVPDFVNKFVGGDKSGEDSATEEAVKKAAENERKAILHKIEERTGRSSDEADFRICLFLDGNGAADGGLAAEQICFCHLCPGISVDWV